MRESSLWKWFERANDLVPDPELGLLHMRRVENLVAEGDPDVEGCYKGGAFNIELKVAPRPSRPTTRVLGPADIRPKQVPWAKARWKAGGQSYFLIQVGSSRSARRYLIPGHRASGIVGATEEVLYDMSIIDPQAGQVEIVETAASFRHGSSIT